MASRLLTQRVMFMPNIRSTVKHFRAFSWYNNDENQEGFRIVGRDTRESLTVWPDKKLGPFGPTDRRFPLPGSIGSTVTTSTSTTQTTSNITHLTANDLVKQLPVPRVEEVLQQMEDNVDYEDELSDAEVLEMFTGPGLDDQLECVMHHLPENIRKDFKSMFPWMDIMDGDFTAITISQKTQADMTGWSEEVEVERDELIHSFVQGATEICEALQEAGFWADFIDPSSGKPYLSTENTNDTLFETDERYTKLGYEIDDLGCCKVIRHQHWGTHSFIGCLFTNASMEHPILKLMTSNNDTDDL